MKTTLTAEMIQVLDRLLAETMQFGNMSVAEVRELDSLRTAHEALIAAGLKIGSESLLELYAEHAEHSRSQGITDPDNFNPPAWNPSLAAEGVRQIAEYCQADRS